MAIPHPTREHFTHLPPEQLTSNDSSHTEQNVSDSESDDEAL